MSFQDVERGLAPPRPGPRGDASGSSRGVAAGVFQMNTKLSHFKRLVNTLGTPKDTPELREQLHKSRQDIAQLAKDTANSLKEASDSDHADDVSAGKKLSDAKLAKDFQAVLKDFQDTQKLAAKRETAFAPFDASPAARKPYLNGHSQRQQPDGVQQLQSQAYEDSPLAQPQQRQEVVLDLENELVYNEAVIEERDQGIREIQQQIGEVNEIFKDLAVLVSEQGLAVDSIEANIEGAHGDVVSANTQLRKASRRQKSMNSFTCWLMIVIGVAILIFILVLMS